MKPETSIVKRIQIKASEEGIRLFRNNVGKLQNRDGTWIAYGLCHGSSDLIGWVPVKITELMVGKVVAVFTAVEVKTPKGVVQEDQKSFLGMVIQSGGIGFVAMSEDELVKKIRGYKNGF